VLIAVGVLVFHVLALWGLQSGLLRRPEEVLIPVQLLAEFISPPAPTVVPPPPAPQQHPLNNAKAAPSLRRAVAKRTPPPAAPAGVIAPQPPATALIAPAATTAEAPAIVAVAVAATAAAAALHDAAPTAPRVELPSSNAEYLQNVKPLYPGMSKRLGEQGQVIHSVLIGVDGLPVSAQLVQSSGFDRLDQAAYTAVMGWHYVPGKRNGTPAAMPFDVPITWVLE
jgi:protein TonB